MAPARCTLLVTSAGRRVELINCFRSSAAALGLDLTVIATDLEPPLSAACQVADRSYATPRCTTPECLERLLEICAADAIDLLVPTIDTELEPLAGAAARFRALGTEVSIAAPALVALCRDKLQTAASLAEHGIPVPRSGTLDEALAADRAAAWRQQLDRHP